MFTFTNTRELQSALSSVLSDIINDLANDYMDEIQDFIDRDVYSYDEIWGGRTGDFGSDIEKHYDIQRSGNQYYRRFEIVPNNSMLPLTEDGDHRISVYSQLLEIINGGYDTSKMPPFNFPSHMGARPFWDNFKQHIKDTLKERFVAACSAHGVPIEMSGSVMIE